MKFGFNSGKNKVRGTINTFIYNTYIYSTYVIYRIP